MLPGFHSPAASFDQPFEMLSACHDRVRRSLRLLQRLGPHLQQHGNDPAARDAAADVLRYFDRAAPHHHEDEERHVFPALLPGAEPRLAEAIRQLLADHRAMEGLWAQLRRVLQAVADARQGPFDAEATQLVQRFLAIYEEHLRVEDEWVYPAAVSRLEPAALRAMGEDMAQRRGATPAQGRHLSGDAPD